MGQLSKLPNIGKEVERQLNQVGINTYEELEELGAEKAWLKIQESDKRKAELKEFYNLHKKY